MTHNSSSPDALAAETASRAKKLMSKKIAVVLGHVEIYIKNKKRQIKNHQ